jgi:membrane fusion protein (multidrug efflux system)
MKMTLLMSSSILTGCILLYSCGDTGKPALNPANIPVPVNIIRLKPEKPVYYDKFPGTVVALMQVDIHAVVEGYVTGMFFKEGDQVKKGQKLYTIDDSKYRASMNQASANVCVAESNLEQAQKDADRYNALNERNAVAKQLLDHSITALENAKNQVTAANQELLKPLTDLGYSTITAPFDGTIGISQVKLGNTVITGQTILNTISTDDPMAVEIIVNEKQISRFLKLKQRKPIEADSIFTLGLPDNSIYNKVGQISFLDRGVNPQTGSIIVRVEFPNPAFELRAGMSCTVRVRNDDTSMKILIPSKAIVEQMGEYFVYIAKDTLASLRALQRKVVLGQTIANRVIVKNGLEAGADLIVDGVQKLHDGSLIVTGTPKEQKGAGK